MITAEYLRQILKYEPETGQWTWRVRKGHKKQGSSAGTITSQGYLRININHRPQLAHRLAWLYMIGEWPKEIDHINGNGLDNQWENLRLATRSQNNANRRPMNGLKGVFWHNGAQKWMAQIMVNKKSMYLGLFSSSVEAQSAYANAAMQHFGEFARTA